MLETIGVYTALECVTERILGTKSIWTNALAGCGAGLAFGAKKGPMVGATSGLSHQAACMSCVGVAAFGIVIDMFMFQMIRSNIFQIMFV